MSIKTKLQSNDLASCFPKLRRYCIGLTRERAAADDLAQATCVRALERSDQFRGEASLDRWLIRIARNLWFNHLKSERIRKAYGFAPAHEELLDVLTDTPENDIYVHQMLSAVLSLPKAQREVVILVYIEGWSYREAAERAGIPIGTVMSRLAAARLKLSAIIDDRGG